MTVRPVLSQNQGLYVNILDVYNLNMEDVHELISFALISWT